MKLNKRQIGKLGLYEFQGYIGAMTSPTFGGWRGTDRMIELLSPYSFKGSKILEAGCSTGYITRYIGNKFDCEITGVDLSELLVDIACARSDEQGLKNISFQQANVEELPFPEASFDLVYGQAITALVPDPLKALREYYRVLKPGGKVATLDLFRLENLSAEMIDETNEIMSKVIGAKVNIRTLEQWKQLFTAAGYDKINIQDYYDQIFVRDYSTSETLKITFKTLWFMAVNKNIRSKLLPTLKFAHKFQEALKGHNFGYLIFIGEKNNC